MLISLMQSNTCVTHLDLSDCGLGTEGAVAITTMFKENCYITHLVHDERGERGERESVCVLTTGSVRQPDRSCRGSGSGWNVGI